MHDIERLHAEAEDFSIDGEIFDERASLEMAEPIVKSCVETLTTSAPATAKLVAAGNLRLLAKHRSDFRELIGSSGAIQALIPLLRIANDPITQETAVTALLNLSLEECNLSHIIAAGAIAPLVHALQTGTSTAKQNAACALLSLSMIEENRIAIGVCGAIPHLVSMLVEGSRRGKKDALAALYKLCGARGNKERAVSAGAVTPLVALVAEGGRGTAEKAMVVLSSLAAVEDGMEAIVKEGGIPAMVAAVEEGPERGKEFAVLALTQLCAYSARNRGLLVREEAIPPLASFAHTASPRVKHQAVILLGYLRETQQSGLKEEKFMRKSL